MKKAAVALVLIVASIALVACGSSSSSSSSESTATETTTESNAGAGGGEAGGGSGGASSTVEIEADPGGQLAYTAKTVTAKAGKVTIDFKNPQPLAHDVAIEDANGKTIGQTELVTEGSSSTVVTLKPGTYTFYCTVPGHREAGMEGTLTVK